MRACKLLVRVARAWRRRRYKTASTTNAMKTIAPTAAPAAMAAELPEPADAGAGVGVIANIKGGL